MSLLIKNPEAYAVIAGVWTTVTAADAIATGLLEVKVALATLQSDPVDAAACVTVTVPTQSVSPGLITVKTWKPTAGGNTSLVPATTFGQVVHWVAFGR